MTTTRRGFLAMLAALLQGTSAQRWVQSHRRELAGREPVDAARPKSPDFERHMVRAMAGGMGVPFTSIPDWDSRDET